MRQEAIVLRGGRVLDPATGRDEVADILVVDGLIEALGDVATVPEGADTVECAGALIAPGFVDLHTHLREPGYEHKETVVSGTRAAAVGGFTAVTAMANTDPATDHAAIVHEVRDLAAAAGLADVFPVGAITKGLAGESLADMGEMVEAGVRLFSDDGHCVASARVLRNALTYARAFPHEVVIANHAEDPALVERGQMHEGVVSSTLGLAGRPAEAEEVIVARDLAMARLTGGRIHVLHISSSRAVALVRAAKAEGIRVSAEVTPHHLLFTDEDLRTYDTNLKVNPPIRTEQDRDELRRALADGTIDAIATDHAPHAVEEKEAEFDLSPPGTIGLETAFGAAVTALVDTGIAPLSRVIEAMTAAPARILGANEHGGPLEPGRPANLVVLDPERSWVPEPPFASRSRNSAFIGHRLTGAVRATMLRGAWTCVDGKAVR